MKKQILALGLIAASSQMIAGDCCSPCCCCVLEPTECVSGVAYTVPFYDLQCDWGVFVDVEFLYFYARETDLAYSLTQTMVAQGPQNTNLLPSVTEVNFIKSKWDPGFRVGLGWNCPCDGWDTYLNYSWLRNSSSTSTAVDPSTNPNILDASSILNPWVNGAGLLTYNKVSAKWNFRWNSIDLELGRKYWLSNCFNMRPYAGLRGAWWKTQFRTTSSLPVIPTSTETVTQVDKDLFRNTAWGVGLVAGIQPAWYFCCDFALYSNLGASLIWGKTKLKKTEKYSVPSADPTAAVDFTSSYNSTFSQMTPIVDLGLGVRWEDTWCCDRYRTTLDLGWEHHIYFDQNHRVKTSGPTGAALLGAFQESGNIGFGGFVLRGRFDF